MIICKRPAPPDDQQQQQKQQEQTKTTMTGVTGQKEEKKEKEKEEKKKEKKKLLGRTGTPIEGSTKGPRGPKNLYDAMVFPYRDCIACTVSVNVMSKDQKAICAKFVEAFIWEIEKIS